MKKKIIAIGIIGMFLLMSLPAVSAVYKKTTEGTGESGVDLAVEIGPLWDLKDRQMGLSIKVTNLGTETVKGPIFGTLKVYRGFGFLKLLKNEQKFTVLEGWQELKTGEETSGGFYPAFLLGSGVHINHFVFELEFNDVNQDNNMCEQTALSASFIFYGLMWFI